MALAMDGNSLDIFWRGIVTNFEQGGRSGLILRNGFWIPEEFLQTNKANEFLTFPKLHLNTHDTNYTISFNGIVVAVWEEGQEPLLHARIKSLTVLNVVKIKSVLHWLDTMALKLLYSIGTGHCLEENCFVNTCCSSCGCIMRTYVTHSWTFVPGKTPERVITKANSLKKVTPIYQSIV